MRSSAAISSPSDSRMERATRCPQATASTMNDGPCTQSPPQNSLATPVWPPRSAATNPRWVSGTAPPGDSMIWPEAKITRSAPTVQRSAASTSLTEAKISLPLSGSNPIGCRGAKLTADTVPRSSPWISLTMTPHLIVSPISLASCNSLPNAGRRSSGSIATIHTSRAPSLIELWQASVAMAPPPTTTTRPPTGKLVGILSYEISRRKVMASVTWVRSLPGMGRIRPFIIPMDTNTASYSARRSSTRTSSSPSPTLLLVRTVIPAVARVSRASWSTSPPLSTGSPQTSGELSHSPSSSRIPAQKRLREGPGRPHRRRRLRRQLAAAAPPQRDHHDGTTEQAERRHPARIGHVAGGCGRQGGGHPGGLELVVARRIREDAAARRPGGRRVRLVARDVRGVVRGHGDLVVVTLEDSSA